MNNEIWHKNVLSCVLLRNNNAITEQSLRLQKDLQASPKMRS